ncbi:MAG: hypothetical protein H0W13_07145 [Nitrospirales bacterium]|nr:hypothetical protein [Nitrospirales bacterium]
MKELFITFSVVLLLYTPSWAEDPTAQPPASSEELKVEDLPKPIVELMTQLQRLSREIEPQITKLGSKLGQELDQTVKKLKKELQSQQRRQSE